MVDETNEPAGADTVGDSDASGEDVSRLQAELESLRAENEALRTGRHRRWHKTAVITLTIVAALSVAASVLTLWVRETLLDTDEWVAAVGPIPQQEAVADRLGVFLAAEVAASLELQEGIEDALPEGTKLLAGPLTEAAEGVISEAATVVVGSDAFRAVWEEANRIAHPVAVDVLRGDISAESVRLDLSGGIALVLNELGQGAEDLFGVEIPEVSADAVAEDLPAVREALADALGIELSPEFATFVVYEKETVRHAQAALESLDRITWLLVIIAGVSTILAFYLSRDRNRTLLLFSSSVLGLSLLLMVVGRLLREDILDAIEDEPTRKAVEEAVAVTLRGLRDSGWTLFWLSLIGVVLAYLFGPSGLARRAWVWLTDLVGQFTDSAQRPEGRLPSFMRRYRVALQAVGAGVAVLVLLLIPNPTWTGFLIVVLVLAAYVAVVQKLGSDDAALTP